MSQTKSEIKKKKSHSTFTIHVMLNYTADTYRHTCTVSVVSWTFFAILGVCSLLQVLLYKGQQPRSAGLLPGPVLAQENHWASPGPGEPLGQEEVLQMHGGQTPTWNYEYCNQNKNVKSKDLTVKLATDSSVVLPVLRVNIVWPWHSPLRGTGVFS